MELKNTEKMPWPVRMRIDDTTAFKEPGYSQRVWEMHGIYSTLRDLELKSGLTISLFDNIQQFYPHL